MVSECYRNVGTHWEAYKRFPDPYLYLIATLQNCGEVKGRKKRILGREERERRRGRKRALLSLAPPSHNPSFATECGLQFNVICFRLLQYCIENSNDWPQISVIVDRSLRHAAAAHYEQPKKLTFAFIWLHLKSSKHICAFNKTWWRK